LQDTNYDNEGNFDVICAKQKAYLFVSCVIALLSLV